MPKTVEEEILSMLVPKIKSVLKQTAVQNRDDLEQELILLVLIKISSGFNDAPSFFELMEEDPLFYDHN